jgi:hypothetical protein
LVSTVIANVQAKDMGQQDAQKGCSARPQRVKTKGLALLTLPPKLPRQLVLQVGYVEDLNDARTTHGKWRVSVGRVRRAAFQHPAGELFERQD